MTEPGGAVRARGLVGPSVRHVPGIPLCDPADQCGGEPETACAQEPEREKAREEEMNRKPPGHRLVGI